MSLLKTVVAIALALGTNMVHAQGYSSTCNTFSVTGNHYYRARCGDGAGGYKFTTEDLNLCLANDHGTVVGRNKYDA